MKYYYGIVEDRQDPLKVGRVRVRVHGIHTETKTDLSTPDLPWAQVMLPTTSAGLSGFGAQHGLVEGSTVIVFFKDEKTFQLPVVIGSTAGIPAGGYKQDGLGKLIKRKVDDGFNDPRRLTVSEYDNTPDGKNPDHSKTRGFGLTTALDTAPKIYKTRTIDYEAKGSTIEEPTLTEKDLPYYPLYTDRSDLSPQSRNDKDLWSYDDRGIPKDILSKEIKSPANPVYPYNKALFTESGHLFELDDTLGAERIAIEHRSGTFEEIHPDGSKVTRVVNDNYTVVCKDEEVYIGGKVNITVGGDAKITVGGKTDIDSKDNLSIVAPEIQLIGTVVKLNS
tara:strand:+ start:3750 stop:4754 length:1005 start_codon:yes stop_codon:yes gene_type:complete